jgi:hypothetical protein
VKYKICGSDLPNRMPVRADMSGTGIIGTLSLLTYAILSPWHIYAAES